MLPCLFVTILLRSSQWNDKDLKGLKFGFIYLIFLMSAISDLAFLVKEIWAAFENVIKKKKTHI